MNTIKSQHIIAPVIKRVTVALPVDTAFQLFTEKAASWWPLDSHSVSGLDAVTCILEGRVGGRFYEVEKDGREHEWGKVIAWEQNEKIVLIFHPGRPVETAGEVEILFEEDGKVTSITLTHRGWDLFGEKAQTMRDGYDIGWDLVLRKFIEKVSGKHYIR